MAKQTYWEKLQDPRWQRRRLEVLEDHGFQCKMCEDDKATLHVHHGYYEKGLEPWEYDTESLFCVCASCHAKVEQALLEVHRIIGRFPLEMVLDLPRLLKRLYDCWPSVCIDDDQDRLVREHHERVRNGR